MQRQGGPAGDWQGATQAEQEQDHVVKGKVCVESLLRVRQSVWEYDPVRVRVPVCLSVSVYVSCWLGWVSFH